MDFFEKFKQAEYEFTYGAEDDPEHHNALQVGLVAYFYLDKGYTQENRERIADAYQTYINEFGVKLTWGYIDDPNKPMDYKGDLEGEFKKTSLIALERIFISIGTLKKVFVTLVIIM